MPDITKKPGEMEFIGGNGGKAAMFKSVKQELAGDDGKSGAQSDLWIIGAIVVGLYLVMLIVAIIVRMLKKGANQPTKEDEPDENEDAKSEDGEELFYEDLDLEELERKQQLERKEYLSGLSEEEKQELRRQIEEELDYLYELPDDWADRDSREYEEVDNRINELASQRRELMSEEELEQELEQVEKEYRETYWREDLEVIVKELEDEEEQDSEDKPDAQHDKDEPNEKES
ncbi:hypothetical protein [Kingella oralis]|uniref:Uncharacterized protein n=1 Tax=Kingella oralis ATCC 51147 TaxID=629741 RepID=C4GI38_9NEIS|nr:hypothetical protein [Kingella oralis]EEP68626.1 hypothetical protein GCWU000324_00529 [Kingella oralis ATCC 51147]QMT42105.1 hypothetical protein H3L93_08785 [Kingella oralis]